MLQPTQLAKLNQRQSSLQVHLNCFDRSTVFIKLLVKLAAASQS